MKFIFTKIYNIIAPWFCNKQVREDIWKSFTHTNHSPAGQRPESRQTGGCIGESNVQKEGVQIMRKFAPLKSDHPVIGDPCPVCKLVFKTDDEVTLIVTLPADEEEAKKAQQGRAYNSGAEVVHWECRNEP